MRTISTKISIILGLFIACFAFQGCLEEKCTQTKSFQTYTPVYLSLDELRASVTTTAPSELKYPGRIVYYKDYIFINEIHKGIHVIDNRNPSNPVNVSFINIPGNENLVIKDDVLIADLCMDMVSLNIGNLDNIREVGRTKDIYVNPNQKKDAEGRILAYFERQNVVQKSLCNDPKANNSIYEDRGNMFVDESMMAKNTTNVSQVNALASAFSANGSATGISGSMANYIFVDNYLYVLDKNNVNVFNASNTASPVYVSKISIASPETIYRYGKSVFVGTNTGVTILNVANPAAPQNASDIVHVTSCDPVVANDQYAYFTLRSGNNCNGWVNSFEVYDIKNLKNPVQVNAMNMENPYGLTVVNNKAIVADGAYGIKVINVENPSTLSTLSSNKFGSFHDIIAISDKNIIATGPSGIYQYQLNQDGTLSELSKIAVSK